MSRKLSFDCLLESALLDWPRELDFGTLQYSDQESGRYVVGGLGRVADNIEDKYIGRRDEILMRHIHASIYYVAHAVAKYLIKVDVLSIRYDAVRQIFESRLNDELLNTESSWGGEDIALVKAYFADNR